MADVSVTASQVQPGSIDAGADFLTLVAAETIAQGKTCYVNASMQLALADADASALTARTRGIAVNAGSAGQKVTIQTDGPLTLGAAATLTVGASYYQSPNPGGICLIADVLQGDYVTYLGIAITAAILDMQIHQSGVQVP